MAHDLRIKQAEVHLTYRCDLACPSCNRGCFYKKPWIPDMTMPTFVRLMDDIDRLCFLKRLVILGGEPTLHPDFLVFLSLGKSRGFEQVIYSNGYSAKAKKLAEYVKHEHLGSMKWGTMKQKGSDRELPEQTVFCAPKDLPGVGQHTCNWKVSPACGYSVDELGYTPCPPGGMISYWQCPQVRTQRLEDLLDAEYVEYAFSQLCQYCGAYLESMDTSFLQKRYETLMTESWLKVFDD